MQFEIIDPTPLLADIIDEYQTLIEGSNTRIRQTGPDHDSASSPSASIRIDTEAFRQVILNLLDNACKYGPENQVITVSCRRESGTVIIRVDDEGPGIPDRQKKKVWQVYHRLEREEKLAINGTGIGLSVAQDLIHAMNGQCRVEDAPGGGARFIIELEMVSR